MNKLNTYTNTDQDYITDIPDEVLFNVIDFTIGNNALTRRYINNVKSLKLVCRKFRQIIYYYVPWDYKYKNIPSLCTRVNVNTFDELLERLSHLPDKNQLVLHRKINLSIRNDDDPENPLDSIRRSDYVFHGVEVRDSIISASLRAKVLELYTCVIKTLDVTCDRLSISGSIFTNKDYISHVLSNINVRSLELHWPWLDTLTISPHIEEFTLQSSLYVPVIKLDFSISSRLKKLDLDGYNLRTFDYELPDSIEEVDVYSYMMSNINKVYPNLKRLKLSCTPDTDFYKYTPNLEYLYVRYRAGKDPNNYQNIKYPSSLKELKIFSGRHTGPCVIDKLGSNQVSLRIVWEDYYNPLKVKELPFSLQELSLDNVKILEDSINLPRLHQLRLIDCHFKTANFGVDKDLLYFSIKHSVYNQIVVNGHIFSNNTQL